jgi:hypothetical protein
MKDQSQESGDDSLNIQVGKDVNITMNDGISAAEATEIALAVGRSNMIEFKGYADELVNIRVEQIVAMFIERVTAHPLAHLGAVKDPDVQYSLLTAEKEYAWSGEKYKAELLVDMLVNRCISDSRGLQALVINEAIATVARLTSRQINTLTACWLITRVKYRRIETIQDYAAWVSAHLEPVLDIAEHQAEYQHIGFLGCASFNTTRRSFGEGVAATYPGAFASGLHADGIPPALRSYPNLFTHRRGRRPGAARSPGPRAEGA